MNNKNALIGVKIISVLYFISSVLELIYGVLLFIGSIPSLAPKANILLYYLAYLNPFLSVGVNLIGFIMLNVIVLIGLAILNFFVARGLWKRQDWARTGGIIFSILGSLLSIGLISRGNVIYIYIIGLVVNLGIGGYLMLSNDIKSAFS